MNTVPISFPEHHVCMFEATLRTEAPVAPSTAGRTAQGDPTEAPCATQGMSTVRLSDMPDATQPKHLY